MKIPAFILRDPLLYGMIAISLLFQFIALFTKDEKLKGAFEGVSYSTLGWVVLYFFLAHGAVVKGKKAESASVLGLAAP